MTNEQVAQEADDRAMADMVFRQLSKREVRWICPYCGTELPDEQTPHCGEVHARPMTDEECDEA